MRVFLAGTDSRENMGWKELEEIRYVLLSFYAIRTGNPKTKERIKRMNKENFLLDSGAFTFMADFQKSKKKQNINIAQYVKEYIEFINEYDIKYFFEMDIDMICGYEKVLEMRKQIEQGTRKRCIPVFHKSRGLKEWERMCQEYDYVAIGSMAEYKGREDVIKALVKIAAKYGAKVHGLGFTNSAHLDSIHFYSVDSTSWLAGGRFGAIHRFDGKKIIAQSFKDKRRKHYKELDYHNLKEWIKFQEYAKTNL